MLLSAACAARGEVGFPFIRIDLDDTDAWEGGLKNLRFVADQRYALQKMIPTPGFDPDFRPAEKGLDTLCISGSAQFSVPQFRNLAATLREYAGDRTVYIFDLRQESHFFVNGGIPLSVYGVHNWANAGMTHEEVEEDEPAQQEPETPEQPEGENTEEGSEGATAENGGDGGNGSDGGNNGGSSGKKTVTRTIERTEERTITRDLTFMPEN